MRWFKHKSDLRDHPQIRNFLDQCGDPLAGYGFLMSVMEVVSASIEKGDTLATVSYSTRNWCRYCDVHHHKLKKFMDLLSVTSGVEGYVTAISEGSNIRVTIPKLLIWRDEYSRKSGQNQERVLPDAEADTDKDKDTKLEANKNKSFAEKFDFYFDQCGELYRDLNGEPDPYKIAKAINKGKEPSESQKKAAIKCAIRRRQKKPRANLL